MNIALFFCYSPAVKGFSPFSGANQEQFDRFLKCLQFGHKNQPKNLAQATRDFVEGLAYTGLRKEEAQLLRVSHVDTKNW